MIENMDCLGSDRFMQRFTDRWCYFGGKTEQKQESKNTVDPAQMALFQHNYDVADQQASSPFTPYTGQRIADFSGTQNQGFNELLAAAHNNVGGGSLDSAKQAFGGILNYAPNKITSQNVGFNGVTAGQVTPQMLADTDLSKYLNPYTQNVIDASMADLQHQRGQQQVSDNQMATARHAFGGSGAAVRDAITSNDYSRNAGLLSANLHQQGYANAQDAAVGDITRKLGADQFNVNTKLGADQFNSTGQYGADTFNSGQNFAAQNANSANDFQAQNMRFNAGTAFSHLSDQELNQAIQRAGLTAGVGEQQTAQNQSSLDAQYEEFLRMLADPYAKQNLRNSALGILPLQQTTTGTTTQSTNPGIGGILGGIGSLGLGVASLGTSTLGGAALGGLFGLGKS